MIGGTIGGRLAQRLDVDRDAYMPVTGPDGAEYMGECHAHGIKRSISRKMLDAIGEQEFSDRTWGGFAGRPICAVCQQAMSANGACGCNDGGRDLVAQILASVGLEDPR